MVKHYNPTIAEDAARIFNTKSGDILGSEIMPSIQPTIEIQRKCNIVKFAERLVSNSSTVIYTTPADKDFYLVSATLSFAKDAACDAAIGNISLRASIDGVQSYLILQSVLTLTAQYGTETITLPVPVKIDRNTAINAIHGTYTVGLRAVVASLIGYTIETTKGV